MTKYKVQGHKALIEEMKAVARGDKPAPADAAMPSVESAEVLLRLLTKENRDLLRMIRDQKPESVADLARMSHRAQPNLLRTLNKLEAFGLIEMRVSGNRRMPVSKVKRLSVKIDPHRQRRPSGHNPTEESTASRVISMGCGISSGPKRLIPTTRMWCLT